MAKRKDRAGFVVNSTSDLRQILIDTISDIRHGGIEAKNATAIASLAGKILQSAKLDLDCARFRHSMDNNKPANPPKPLRLVGPDEPSSMAV